MAGGLAETALLLTASLAMSSIVIMNAFYQKEQFYSSVVYITKSNASMAIMYVQALVGVYLFGNIMKKIFFGTLRPAEFEHVVERSWYALTETCLAFTVFRDDLSPKFVALFTCLFSLKLFHWLAEDRVDYMERSPNISLLFHVRVNSLLLLLGFLDIYSVYSAYQSIMENGPSVQLVFGFEYAILFAVVINIAMKYVLHTLDMNNENPWEDKAIYLLYTEMIMSILKIVLYTMFILIMVKFHTFPLFAIRPMYLAIKSFRSSYNDIVMSRQAIQNMNTLYPNATEDDIANSDNVCIICRDIMHGNGTCKKLPCNHILHISCLRSWFQRQQTCPTCRMDVLQNLRTQNNGQAQANNNNINNNLNNIFNNNNDNNNNINNNNNNNNNAQNAQQPRPNGGNERRGSDPNNPQPRPVHAQGPIIFGDHIWAPNMRIFRNDNNLNNENARAQNNPNSANPQGSGQQPPRQNVFSAFNASNTNSNSNSGTIPDHIFPHLATPPFPMPELSISSFFNRYTEQQLRDMEGHHRESVEARLKLLADTQVLIDCAMEQLTLYNSILANMKTTQTQSSQTAQTSQHSAAGGDSGQSSSGLRTSGTSTNGTTSTSFSGSTTSGNSSSGMPPSSSKPASSSNASH